MDFSAAVAVKVTAKRNIMNVILSGRNAELSVDVLKGSTLDWTPPKLICKYTQIFAIK